MASKSREEPPVIPIFKSSGYYIPIKYLESQDIQRAEDLCTYRFYKESMCRKCENLKDRHNDVCDPCGAFTGQIRTVKVVRRNEKSYLRFPGGARIKLKQWLEMCGKGDSYEIRKKHGDPDDFKRPIRFIGKPHDYQTEAVKVLLKKKRGILESPPRSGKTVMGAMLICTIGKKTLILAAQMEWLINFQETFVGSEKVKSFTTCKPSRIGVIRKIEDVDKYDICLSTFAFFFGAHGKKKLKLVKDSFGVVMIDEVHGTPAKETAKVATAFNAEYFIGLSGTVERKMTAEIEIALDVVGPIIHECAVERLVPRAIPLFTGIKIRDPKPGHQAGFTYFQSRLESDSARNNLLVTQVIKYAKAGHLVLLPVSRVNSVLKLTRMINQEMEQAGYALPFYGGLKKEMRQTVIQKARDFECRVVVGNISLLSTGVNIPRASCIFEVGATNNIPKCDQRLSRILTPMPGKPEPIIVVVLDESDMLRKCRRSEWWGCVHPRFKPTMDSGHRRDLMEYFADKGEGQRKRVNFKEGV